MRQQSQSILLPVVLLVPTSRRSKKMQRLSLVVLLVVPPLSNVGSVGIIGCCRPIPMRVIVFEPGHEGDRSGGMVTSVLDKQSEKRKQIKTENCNNEAIYTYISNIKCQQGSYPYLFLVGVCFRSECRHVAGSYTIRVCVKNDR